MGIIDSIKNNVAKSGTNKDKILYVKSDSKVRIRFLQEFDTGYEFTFHDSYAKGINALCQEELGKTCPLCGDEELRTRTLYSWSVYNYDSKRVEVLLYAVNNCTPVAALMNMFETYGTILDRDYVLAKNGKSKDASFTVIPQDKQRFRNDKAKPYTKSALLKIVSKAYPLPTDYEASESDFDDLEVEEEEDEPKPKKQKKAAQKPKQKARKASNEDTDDTDEEEFAMIDEDEVEESFSGKEKPKKKKAEPEKSNNISVEEMEEILDDEDIDIDEFLEYVEKPSLKRIKTTEKKFSKLVKDYIDSLEDEEEDDDFEGEEDY